MQISSRASGAPPRILVVEDEALIGALAVENLEELGFAAEVVGTAAAARSALGLLEGRVAAAIIDIGLPDAPGDVLVGQLRALYPELPIVVSSGHSEAVLRDRFKGQRAIGFLNKPYSLEQMRSALLALAVRA